MYTLHFSPGSCSLIVNCLLEELGVAFELKRAHDYADNQQLEKR